MSGAGSGVCELTNQGRLGVQDGWLMETVAKTKGFRERENTVLEG